MLSRASRVGMIRALGTRSYFDYVKMAELHDQGVSLDEQVERARTEAGAEKAKDFTWTWLKWFEENKPQELMELNPIKQEFQRYEQFVTRGGQSGGSKTVDFSGFRKKIADPQFVDQMEVDYFVKRDTLSSIENMATLTAWTPEALQQFEREAKESGQLLWKPMTAQERANFEQRIKKEGEKNEQLGDEIEELTKDFEQMDVERLMFGQTTYMMKMSSHPMMAEHVEDGIMNCQSAVDNQLWPLTVDEMKRQRLHQIQDENQRKTFLENFEKNAAIYNGMRKEDYQTI